MHSDNLATNLLLEQGEALTFTLTTLMTNETDPSSEELPDEEFIVSVEAFGKTEGGYDLAVPLDDLFTEDHSALAPTDGEGVAYNWVVNQEAQSGTYRLVFTFADRVEYLYFVIH